MLTEESLHMDMDILKMLLIIKYSLLLCNLTLSFIPIFYVNGNQANVGMRQLKPLYFLNIDSRRIDVKLRKR